MLIIHGTAAFRARVPGAPLGDESSTTALGGWYAHLIRRRKPFALLVNERTQVAVVMALAPAKTLAARFPAAAAEVMGALGIPRSFIDEETAAMQEVRIAPTANRSLVGVMNDLIRMLDRWEIDDDTDLVDLSLWLAEHPSGRLQYAAPEDELRRVVGELGHPTPRRGRRGRAVEATPPSPFPASVPLPGGGEARIEHRPGLAESLLQELKPLLAAEGIDLDDPDTLPDPATLQAGLDRATERHNMALFTPVGGCRAAAVTLLRQFATAVADGDDQAALAVLDRARPESRDERIPEVSAVIGVALGLLDEWLSGRAAEAPKDLVAGLRVPREWRKTARPAAEILALGSRDRAVESLTALITRQGGHAVLAGAALALALAVGAWADRSGTPLGSLLPRIVR